MGGKEGGIRGHGSQGERIQVHVSGRKVNSITNPKNPRLTSSSVALCLCRRQNGFINSIHGTHNTAITTIIGWITSCLSTDIYKTISWVAVAC